MASDESDDEPLSVLAAAKKINPEKFKCELDSVEDEVYRKRKPMPVKKSAVTIKIKRKLSVLTTPTVIERPSDVWLYLKDLNPTGPYKCLLCADWFINRSKMIVHYILNHGKDFCSICRYLVIDRDSWKEHIKFHTPWPCSQCVESFQDEVALRQHLSSVHQLIHCRLCHFRVPVGEQYDEHLIQKHNVSNLDSKDSESLWEVETNKTPKFNCLLCCKTDNMTTSFFTHYMGFHHFTLKCITNIISGMDTPFTVHGAELSTEFVDGQLKDLNAFGYVDGEKPDNEQDTSQTAAADSQNTLILEIKKEVSDCDDTKVEDESSNSNKIESQNESVEDSQKHVATEDFDITQIEVLIAHKGYFDYINQLVSNLAQKSVPVISEIDTDKAKTDAAMDIDCPLCDSKFQCAQTFITHMYKIHSIKSEPEFFCRICATTFDTSAELDDHISKELGDFEDLWICQFCEKEFNNRGETRKHMNVHWKMIEYDNCFSPHLGFKCQYCPTLFWNETDREIHQLRVHYIKNAENFYQCSDCTEKFSDKVWFTHHHLDKHVREDSETESYLLKCRLCSCVFANIHDIRKHFDSEHPIARKLYCTLDPCKYKPFGQKKSFNIHMKTMHGPARPEKPVACAVCGREFPTLRACNSHAAQVHGPGKFKCKLCKAALHTVDERKLHYLLIHPGRHPYECSVCGKSFQYKSSLYMHKQEHQPNKQTFTCNYCSKVFMKKDSFREHLQIHEGPRHACSYCPMRFVQRSNMLRHERRHTGERPYACPHCPRTFADKGACTSHAKTHTRESSYACVYCGQTFVQKSKLTYHIRKHTGENLETCPVCAKLFTSACSLREHMKIHLCKKEAVKCPLCDKKYGDERYMLRHLRTQHTQTQYTCPLCHKQVSTVSGLRHHVITHSPLNTFRCKICPKSYAVKRTIIKHLRRRHNLTGDTNLKEHYTRLEPRQCRLPLDEETLTGIFGPPKNDESEVLIADYVTYAKDFKLKKGKSKEQSEDDKESDSNSDNEGSQRDMEEDGDGDGEVGELEPTDFVSVKIEPIDDYEKTEED